MIFMDRIEEIKKEVERRVANEKRFRHIMGVVDECEKLARLYSLSETDARRTVMAGLLHDITKTLPNEEHEMLMSDLGKKLDEETKKCPKTMHQVTGAYLSKALYPEEVDDAVFSAVRYHTTGRAEMTLIEKLVYLADYIEVNRRHEECVSIRNLFYGEISKENADIYRVLDRVIFKSLDDSIKQMKADGRYIHNETISAYDYFKRITDK